LSDPNSLLMKLIQIIVLGIFINAFATLTFSQQKEIYSDLYSPEKIYLQPDGSIYTNNQTVWYKAIVVKASDHTPTKLSGVLYVELISPDEKILEKKLIKVENGTGSGFFDLNQNYNEGKYLIRAYTEWDKNFGNDFFFQEYIKVFTPDLKAKAELISNITIVENAKNHHLIAYVDNTAIDTIKKGVPSLSIYHDKSIDTLAIKKERGKYIVEYEIADSCQFVTLKILSGGLSSYTKTIVLDEDHLDLQFFPESGELVDGISGRVGFKALDYTGKGKYLSGEIVNDKGEVLTGFKSNQLGMGSFMLLRPDIASSYFARLKSQSDSSLTNLYPLPKVSSHGNVLSVIKNAGLIRIKATSTYLRNDSVFVKVACRGLVYYVIRGKLKDGELAFSLSATKLPDGVVAFTLLDNNYQPVAERLFFNENLENRINVEISADRDIYSQRDLTRIRIKTTDYKLTPVNANLSLLVLNKKQMGQIQDDRQNILSWFLLNSDLKGEIEDPGFYFRKNSNPDELDELMLTQGWRKYLYEKTIDTLRYMPEARLNLSGTIQGILPGTKKKDAQITMMTFGRKKAVQTVTTDSIGKFYFNLNDEYGLKLNTLIQTSNRKGYKKDYSIILDKKESPKIFYNHVPDFGKADSVVRQLVEKKIELKKVEETYKMSGGIVLGEVKVESYKLTSARKKVMQQYGKPDAVIEGEAIQAKEEKWSYGLYSVIQSKFRDIHIFRTWDGELLAEVRPSVPTCIVVDGSVINMYDYNYIAFIPPSEVSSFEIVKNISNKDKVWFEFCPECLPLSLPQMIDIIAIYTYGGNGLFGVRKNKGIVKTTVPVFSEPKVFYSPQYQNLKPDDWYKPDLRSLIHWEPNLQTDSDGMVFASFYNADIDGEMEVVVEAISEDGEIGYNEFSYKVIKRDSEK
jgi:hypothetical protein